MTKRRDIVRKLKDAGFVSHGGTNHELFVKPGYRAVVPRHREIPENTVRNIYRQAGLE